MERRRGCCRCEEPTAGSQPPSGSGGPGLAGGTSGSSAVTVNCGITGAGGARGSPLGTCPPRLLAPRARGSPAAAAAATAAQRASKSRRSSPTLRRGARSSPGLQGPAPPGRAMLVGPPGRVISPHASRSRAHQPAPRRGLETLGAPGARLPRGGACAACPPGPRLGRAPRPLLSLSEKARASKGRCPAGKLLVAPPGGREAQTSWTQSQGLARAAPLCPPSRRREGSPRPRALQSWRWFCSRSPALSLPLLSAFHPSWAKASRFPGFPTRPGPLQHRMQGHQLLDEASPQGVRPSEDSVRGTT